MDMHTALAGNSINEIYFLLGFFCSSEEYAEKKCSYLRSCREIVGKRVGIFPPLSPLCLA